MFYGNFFEVWLKRKGVVWIFGVAESIEGYKADFVFLGDGRVGDLFLQTFDIDVVIIVADQALFKFGDIEELRIRYLSR